MFNPWVSTHADRYLVLPHSIFYNMLDPAVGSITTAMTSGYYFNGKRITDSSKLMQATVIKVPSVSVDQAPESGDIIPESSSSNTGGGWGFLRTIVNEGAKLAKNGFFAAKAQHSVIQFLPKDMQDLNSDLED